MKRPLPLLALLLTVGCTPMAYTRPGASEEQAKADEHDCRGFAAREAWPFSAPYFYSYPYRRYRGYGADPFMDRMLNESSLADFCMRTRGYQLQPVAPKPS